MRTLLGTATARLRAAGVPSARHDAEALAAHAFGVRRQDLIRLEPDDDTRTAYRRLVDRRADREPLQHIVGTAPFRHLEIAVGRGVFVPRPETEVVAGYGIDSVRDLPSPLCVDLCAGSGAIALALATEVPAARVHAVESESAALVWLRRNVAGLRSETSEVTVHQADATDPGTLAALNNAVDLVISNPPYIPDDASPLDPEVAGHDPAAALWGGPDGFDVMRGVLATAARLLRPGGVVVVEHADVQADGAIALLGRLDGWQDITDHPDLTGRDRFVTACRSQR